jgi:hypothetical protein
MDQSGLGGGEGLMASTTTLDNNIQAGEKVGRALRLVFGT